MTNEQIVALVDRLTDEDIPGEEIEELVSNLVNDDPTRLRAIGEALLKRGEAYLAEARRRREA